MSIDRSAFPKAVERFVQDMGRIHDIYSPDIAAALEPICRVMGVAEISVTYLEVPAGGAGPRRGGGPPAGFAGAPEMGATVVPGSGAAGGPPAAPAGEGTSPAAAPHTAAEGGGRTGLVSGPGVEREGGVPWGIFKGNNGLTAGPPPSMRNIPPVRAGGPPAGVGGPPPGVGGPPAGVGGPPAGVGGPPPGVGGPPPGVGGPPPGVGGPPPGVGGPPPGMPQGPIGGLMGGLDAGFPNLKRGESASFVFWSGGNVDTGREVRFNETTSNGATAYYSLFQCVGDPDWTEKDLACLHSLERLFFIFNTKIRLENVNERLTYHDRDTGVHNIGAFMRLAGGICFDGRGYLYGVCRCNLRNYSMINRRFGWKAGTDVMRAFAQGMEAQLTEAECVCRLGGDNFAVLFLKEHLDTVVKYLSGVDVLTADGRKARVSSYAGYYMVPPECRAPNEMLDRATSAMNIAKNVLKTDVVFFDEQLSQRDQELKDLENAFPSALKNEEFQVWYQPKVSLRDYRLHGAEALCRWLHDGELIPPGRFIPSLEEGNGICQLDFYMLDHACRDIRAWLDRGLPAVRVSVNLSRRHLGDTDLLSEIISTIDRHNVPHELVEIELTETTTDVDYGELKTIVNGLRDAGIHTSVDDFGIGYSSLNLIKELPWDVLKIDKSFLPDEERDDAQTSSVLKHVIALAQDIGLECIVEGVETAEQVRLLKENNCFLAQGFFFDRPLPRQEFEQRLLALKDSL